MVGVTWQSVLIPAAVSGIVSVLISILTISQVTVRSARAERREGARVSLARRAAAMRLTLRQYRQNDHGGRRRPDAWVADDAVAAAGALAEAEDLSPIRRRLVHRRIRRVFGSEAFDVAELVDPARASDSAVVTSLVRQAARIEGKLPPGLAAGILHEAYAAEPLDQRLCDRLDRELRLLGRAW